MHVNNAKPANTLQSRSQMGRVCAPSRNTLARFFSWAIHCTLPLSIHPLSVPKLGNCGLCQDLQECSRISIPLWFAGFQLIRLLICGIPISLDAIAQLEEALTFEEHWWLLQDLIVIDFDGPDTILGSRVISGMVREFPKVINDWCATQDKGDQKSKPPSPHFCWQSLEPSPNQDTTIDIDTVSMVYVISFENPPTMRSQKKTALLLAILLHPKRIVPDLRLFSSVPQ